MLGKLIKYELKATNRIFIPFYIAILVLSALFGFNSINFEDSSSLMMALLPITMTIAFVGLSVMTIITVIKRFDSNLLSDEGYLMFTLPVSISQLLNSKIIVSLLWGMFTGIIFVLSTLLVFRTQIMFPEIQKLLSELSSNPKFLSNVLFIALWAVMIYLNFLLKVYASLSISQSYAFTKSRILGGIIVFIVFSMISSTLQKILSVFFMEIYGSQYVTNHLIEGKFFNLFSLSLLMYTILTNAAFYYLAYYHMKYKLNLD